MLFIYIHIDQIIQSAGVQTRRAGALYEENIGDETNFIEKVIAQ